MDYSKNLQKHLTNLHAIAIQEELRKAPKKKNYAFVHNGTILIMDRFHPIKNQAGKTFYYLDYYSRGYRIRTCDLVLPKNPQEKDYN